MMYLLDANVLIDAHRDYYPLARVPEFWRWLTHHGTSGSVKIALEIYEEVKRGDDELAHWLREPATQASLLLAHEPDPVLVRRVIEDGYAADLTDDELERLGRDPFLIAYALASPAASCVVTTERSRPSRVRGNRHIPDVCSGLGVRACHTFDLLRELDFRTGWDRV